MYIVNKVCTRNPQGKKLSVKMLNEDIKTMHVADITLDITLKKFIIYMVFGSLSSSFLKTIFVLETLPFA